MEPTINRLKELADLAELAARDAGSLLLSMRGHVEVQEKAPHDLVTAADVASQACIYTRLQPTFPQFGFWGEEEGGGEGAETADPQQEWDRPWWIVDPLDGTTNFVHGLPAFAVSIALWDCTGPLLGIVFDPCRNEMFRAERGSGARCNGEPIQVSGCRELAQALVAAGFRPQVARDSAEVNRFLKVLPVCRAIRRWGAAAINLAYVACGRFDAYWASSIKPWDAAAGAALLHEAGGDLTNLSGGEFSIQTPELIASSHPELGRQLRNCLA